MTLPINTHARVPPGFRFHPTDEELINFYLKRKVSVEKFDLDHVIREVDLNKLEPWDLHERCKVDATHQTEWYFFSHKDKKYPTGTRTNRATAAGFWKATGRDKAVHSNCQRIGMRKTLVFYRGRAPHGQKTEWIMHEYRLEDGEFGSRSNEDGWVVCRVFKKRNQDKTHHTLSNLSEEEPPAPGPAPASKVEYSKKSQEHGAAAPGNTFACKQEVEEAPPQVAFLQLPQLESPKTVIANAGPCYNSADLKRIIAENYKKLEHPSPFLSEGPVTMETFKGRSLCMAEDDLADYVDSGHITDWSLFESISRYHADFSNISVDIPQCVYSSKQQHLEYPSSYEVDLWNFTR